MRVVQIGLGPIGQAVARLAAGHPALALVGGADLDRARIGRDVGELLGLAPSGALVDPSISDLLARARPDLVLHTTGSFLKEVEAQIRECLEHGASVVSTCEELSYPFYRHEELARELHECAVEHRAVLLGAGVNPGFIMDKLVVTLMSACSRVDRVQVLRVVDTARRRAPFQGKVGVGLTVEEFEAQCRSGRLGHVGLHESAHLLADVMGVSSRRKLREELRARVATEPARSGSVALERGQVAGAHQSLVLEVDGQERVRLELEMYAGAPHPRDAISIQGAPSLEMSLTGGVPGDEGTAAVILNYALSVPELAYGLRSILDVPLRFHPEALARH